MSKFCAAVVSVSCLVVFATSGAWAATTPLEINEPYSLTWPVDVEVADCLSASGGYTPYYWRIVEQDTDYAMSTDSNDWFLTGSAIGLQGDEVVQSYALPFEFPFYGRKITSINISSNGFVDMVSTSADPNDSDAGLQQNVRIAPLWDDVDTSSGEVYVDDSTYADGVIIQWEGVVSGAGANFGLILFSDGEIHFDYGSGNYNLDCTVGISAGNDQYYTISADYSDATNLNYADKLIFTPPTQIIPGVWLDPATGCFWGTPTQEGVYNVTIEVKDNPGTTVQQAFTITVGDTPPPQCGDAQHPYPTGDFNHDCHVEWADFGTFATNWQRDDCVADGWCEGVDINQDGTVEWADFGSFAAHWQECTHPDGC